MLATQTLPSLTFPSTSRAEESSSQYRPAKDIESFNALLPPPIEFVEGSSSGTLAVAEGKYEPINVPSAKGARGPPPSADKVPTNRRDNSPKTPKAPITRRLYEGTLNTNWRPGIKVGVGLVNNGNTCFLNSVLQCLSYTPPLINVLLDHGQVEPCRVNDNQFCMACALRKAVLELHTRGRQPFMPTMITSKLQAIAKNMRRGRQEDAHEFLRYAIDALQRSCLAGHPPKLNPKLAETTWVHQIFGGRLRSRVHCRECKHNSDTIDSVLDLSVDIQGCSTLKEALRKFVAIDTLKGANKYKCEKCKRAVVADKSFTIAEAPLILTVHLKRFSPLGRKIGHMLDYPERLDLEPYMSEGVPGRVYSLYGVICHAGSGPNSGHYYAFVKAPSGKWYETNDELVSFTSHVLGKKAAYMLFYMQEKGQALEAAVKLTGKSPSAPRAGGVDGAKKRKIMDSDEEDLGISAEPRRETSKRFIGPLLPAPLFDPDTAPDRSGYAPCTSYLFDPDTPPCASGTDAPSTPPRSNLKNAKAQDPPKTPIVSQSKSSGALQLLAMYSDDEDNEDEKADRAGPTSSPPAGPPSSAAVPSSPAVPIAVSSFYGSSKNKKRKSPEEFDDGDEARSVREPLSATKSRPSYPSVSSSGKRWATNSIGRKSNFGGGAVNPYSRLSGSNNLRRQDSPKRQHVIHKYGSKNRHRKRF